MSFAVSPRTNAGMFSPHAFPSISAQGTHPQASLEFGRKGMPFYSILQKALLFHGAEEFEPLSLEVAATGPAAVV